VPGNSHRPCQPAAALLLVSEQPGEAAAMAGVPRLSARERELVTLVAHGRTNAGIAAQLFISARAVGSHLDRSRDKTGCRRRAGRVQPVPPGPAALATRLTLIHEEGRTGRCPRVLTSER
jgi:DNA-binding CsgD family transcriptional regulator